MAAIVRVKRRRNEEPADSLVISCKRGKLNSGESANIVSPSDDVKTVFKFATTVPEQAAQDVSQHIRTAIRKEKLEKEYKHHNVTYANVAQSRRERSNAAKKGRYKITSKLRGPNLEALDKQESAASEATTEQTESSPSDATERLYHLYDVVQDGDGSHLPTESRTQPSTSNPTASSSPAAPASTITCNGVPMQRTTTTQPNISHNLDTEYVYDLYYMNSHQFDFRMLENVLAIEAQNSEDLYFDYRDDAVCEVYDDDSDSNSEGNWRNDYPDEDPHFFENEKAEYAYGDDDHRPDHAFDEDNLAALIEKKLLTESTVHCDIHYKNDLIVDGMISFSEPFTHCAKYQDDLNIIMRLCYYQGKDVSPQFLGGAESSDEEDNSDKVEYVDAIYSDVEDSDLEDEIPDSEAAGGNERPTRSYDAYKRQILRELGEAI